MSSIDKGKEDNLTCVIEEDKDKYEDKSSNISLKYEEKELSEDEKIEENNLYSIPKFNNIPSPNTEINHNEISEVLQTCNKEQDTIIVLPESITKSEAKSSTSSDNVSVVKSCDSIQGKASTSAIDIPNHDLIFVSNSDGTIEAKTKVTEDAGTQDDGYPYASFHRKDYQVMLFWRGLGGAASTVGTIMRVNKALRCFGGYRNRGCVLNRFGLLMRGGYRPDFCNAYVTFVMLILFVMLLCTAYCLNYNLTSPRVRYYYYENWWQIILGTTVAILLLNYLMFSCVMERYMALNYICLIFAVIACSMFCSAISARLENDALWICNAMTAATVLFLFVLSFGNVDFTHRMLCLIAVLFSLFALLVIIYTNRMYSYFGVQYTAYTIFISAFLGALRVFLLVLELQRLLCSCVAHGCCNHAFGAFILYTLYLQFIFFLFQLRRVM